MARGLDIERVESQRRMVAALDERFAREEEAGEAPPETPAEGFRLLHGCEHENRADATLDLNSPGNRGDSRNWNQAAFASSSWR